MKTIIVVISFILLQLTIAQANVFITPEPPARIRIIVELGQQPFCYMIGICGIRIVPASSHLSALGNSLFIGKDQDFFAMELSREEIRNTQPDKLEFLDGKSEITFDKPYTFPDDIKSALGATKDLVIMPGSYPVNFKDGLFTIKFPY